MQQIASQFPGKSEVGAETPVERYRNSLGNIQAIMYKSLVHYLQGID